MSKNLFFSVIIPTLNEEDYLPKILSDLAKQKQKNFEVIIVDAASEDRTKDAALKFTKCFSLEFIEVKRRNVSFQRNFGARKANGEFLLFLDADTRIKANFTENLDRDICKRKGSLFLPILAAEDLSSKNKVLFKLINSVIELSQSLNKPLSAGGSIFISKKFFFDLNGFLENLYMSEDHNLVQRARKFGVKAKILKNVEVVFSLRRVEKEGQMIFLYKNFLALVYMLINEKITSKLFAYEMGGRRYKNLKKSQEKRSLKGDVIRLQELLKKTSAFFIDSLS